VADKISLVKMFISEMEKIW